MPTKTNIRTIDDIKRLGTIMGIWAHPDDETFSCAGIMLAAIQNGQTVVCITATRGEAGVQDARRWPPEKLADIRTDELRAALRILGVKHHHWLNYMDGTCHTESLEEAAAGISELIQKYQPNTILTFGPDGLTGHTDHQAVNAWVHAAVHRAGSRATIYHLVQSRRCYEECLKALDEQFNIFYNIDQPPLCDEEQCAICFCLADELFAKKLEALGQMPSQTEAILQASPITTLQKAFSTECFDAAEN